MTNLVGTPHLFCQVPSHGCFLWIFNRHFYIDIRMSFPTNARIPVSYVITITRNWCFQNLVSCSVLFFLFNEYVSLKGPFCSANIYYNVFWIGQEMGPGCVGSPLPRAAASYPPFSKGPFQKEIIFGVSGTRCAAISSYWSQKRHTRSAGILRLYIEYRKLLWHRVTRTFSLFLPYHKVYIQCWEFVSSYLFVHMMK